MYLNVCFVFGIFDLGFVSVAPYLKNLSKPFFGFSYYRSKGNCIRDIPNMTFHIVYYFQHKSQNAGPTDNCKGTTLCMICFNICTMGVFPIHPRPNNETADYM